MRILLIFFIITLLISRLTNREIRGWGHLKRREIFILGLGIWWAIWSWIIFEYHSGMSFHSHDTVCTLFFCLSILEIFHWWSIWISWFHLPQILLFRSVIWTLAEQAFAFAYRSKFFRYQYLWGVKFFEMDGELSGVYWGAFSGCVQLNLGCLHLFVKVSTLD